MPKKLEKEPEGLSGYGNEAEFELCCKCNKPTPYWWRNMPLCTSCSKIYKEDELPKWDEYVQMCLMEDK